MWISLYFAFLHVLRISLSLSFCISIKISLHFNHLYVSIHSLTHGFCMPAWSSFICTSVYINIIIKTCISCLYNISLLFCISFIFQQWMARQVAWAGDRDNHPHHPPLRLPLPAQGRHMLLRLRLVAALWDNFLPACYYATNTYHLPACLTYHLLLRCTHTHALAESTLPPSPASQSLHILAGLTLWQTRMRDRQGKRGCGMAVRQQGGQNPHPCPLLALCEQILFSAPSHLLPILPHTPTFTPPTLPATPTCPCHLPSWCISSHSAWNQDSVLPWVHRISLVDIVGLPPPCLALALGLTPTPLPATPHLTCFTFYPIPCPFVATSAYRNLFGLWTPFHSTAPASVWTFLPLIPCHFCHALCITTTFLLLLLYLTAPLLVCRPFTFVPFSSSCGLWTVRFLPWLFLIRHHILFSRAYMRCSFGVPAFLDPAPTATLRLVTAGSFTTTAFLLPYRTILFLFDARIWRCCVCICCLCRTFYATERVVTSLFARSRHAYFHASRSDVYWLPTCCRWRLCERPDALRRVFALHFAHFCIFHLFCIAFLFWVCLLFCFGLVLLRFALFLQTHQISSKNIYIHWSV